MVSHAMSVAGRAYRAPRFFLSLFHPRRSLVLDNVPDDTPRCRKSRLDGLARRMTFVAPVTRRLHPLYALERSEEHGWSTSKTIKRERCALPSGLNVRRRGRSDTDTRTRKTISDAEGTKRVHTGIDTREPEVNLDGFRACVAHVPVASRASLSASARSSASRSACSTTALCVRLDQ